jgi:peptidoglycan/LPS O-acetylase OafA/YrhL
LRKEIIPLTSLRGIAAMAVIAMHYSATMQEIASGNFPSLAPHGSLAVDVFFVLSGFIMGYTYLDSFHAQDTWTAYRKFLGKRAARILPLNAFVTVTLTVVAQAAFRLVGVSPISTVRPDSAFLDLLSNLLLLPGLGIGNSLNWPAWSISVEFAAYFIFPLLLALVFSRGYRLLALTCAAAALGMYASVWPGLNIHGMHNHPWPWRDLLRCVCEFTLGLATFRAYTSGKATRIFSRDDVALAISAAILFVVFFNPGELFAMLLFPALVLSLSLNKGRIASLLSTRFLHFLGKISFSIYLVTDPFRGPAQQLVRWFHPAPLPPHWAMMAAAVCAVAMIAPAWLTYALVEEPSRRALRTLLSGRANRGAVAAQSEQ